MMIILNTFLSSSFLSKAHFCLHCSHVTGGPYFFSELVHRWHLLPMNAAIILQYSHADGFPNCFTFVSHFLQIVLGLPLLETYKIQNKSEHVQNLIQNLVQNQITLQEWYKQQFLLTTTWHQIVYKSNNQSNTKESKKLRIKCMHY
jgi:hypothetical protein